MSTEVNNKKQMLANLAAWIPFVESLGAIEERKWTAPLGEGKWAVRDVVSHIMLWDKYFWESAVAKLGTGEPLTLENLGFEAFNRNATVYGRTIDRDALVRESAEVRSAIVAKLGVIPEEQYEMRFQAVGCTFQINEYLVDFIGHDGHHRRQIEAVLAN